MKLSDLIDWILDCMEGPVKVAEWIIDGINWLLFDSWRE